MRDYVDQIARLRECASNSHEVHLKCGAYLSGVCAKTRDIRMQDAADAIEELLAELVTIRNQLPKWVSAEDELPEENKQIISYLAYKGMAVLQYENKHFYMQGAFQPLPKEAVTHWMPLPEPPKGEDT